LLWGHPKYHFGKSNIKRIHFCTLVVGFLFFGGPQKMQAIAPAVLRAASV
jgi:hypothetical protein